MELVTVQRQFLADLETPISAFQKLLPEGACYLLESAGNAGGSGRYSFLGVGPRVVLSSERGQVTIYRLIGGEWSIIETSKASPLLALRHLLAKYQAAPGPQELKPQAGPQKLAPQATSGPQGLRFSGGAVGYLSYDVVRHLERLPAAPPDVLGLPEAMFVITDAVVIFDHLRHTVTLTASDVDGALDEGLSALKCEELLERIAARLREPVPPVPTGELSRLGLGLGLGPGPGLEQQSLMQCRDLPGDHQNPQQQRREDRTQCREDRGESATLGRDEFCDGVRRAKEYIKSGDIFQVVLSRRESRPLTCSPFDIYRALRSLNPSPYLYYLDFGRIQLIGSSPETLVRLEDGVIESCPIAGTRPRGRDAAQDAALAKELLADEKERAEHVMLVDLARNDVGRVAIPGTVSVPSFMEVEYYSDVMHLVSSVRGRLREGRDAFDVLAACFPAGTVSGAPKVRAMEIIDELEPVRRGPYAGAVGYFGFNGNMDTAITIRTLAVADGLVHVQAGAGIVADSDPEREFLECQHKARAMFRALEWACTKEECDLVASPR